MVSGLGQDAVRELTLPLRHDDIIRQQAAEKDLDPALIAAVIYEESRFRDQTSHAGARGLMQITPETADAIAKHSGGTRFKQEDLAAPQINISYGAYYLRLLLDHYGGNETLAIAAYNAGMGNVDRWVAEAGGPERLQVRRPHPLPRDAGVRRERDGPPRGLPQELRGGSRPLPVGSSRAILNQVVQYQEQLDQAFAALADPTRRGILERLGRGRATISELAEPFGISLTGLKKHVQVLEDADLVRTREGRADAMVQARPAGPREVQRWIVGYRLMLDERLDRLGELLERTKGENVMTQQQARAHVAAEGDREIVTERVFDAPRERVFQAFTDPELIPQWWGRRADTTTVDKMDVREGGDGASSRTDPTATPPSGDVYRVVSRPSASSRPSSGRGCPATSSSRPRRSRISGTAAPR